MTISQDDAAFLLRRAGFGGTSAQIAFFAASVTDWAAAVDRVLETTPATPENPPAAISTAGVDDLTRWAASSDWWMERMRTTPTPIVEKMTMFWHGHFCSSSDKVGMYAMFEQVRLFRAMAMGNFRDLAQAMAVNPAMLDYLDNSSNIKGAANENFARELMELFLMGDFTFTEPDVKAMAKAWTGHGLSLTKAKYEFHEDKHDNSQKTLFGITKNWNGPDAIDEIVLGSKQKVMAKFIAGKVWTFFAAPNPSDSLVSDLADAFIAGGLEIVPLLRAVFMRPEFRSDAVRNGLLRSPTEWVVAVLKALDIPATAARPAFFMGAMGQRLFRPPNVAGWGSNGYWISTSSLWGRAAFVANLRWLATDDKQAYKRFANLKALTAEQIADLAATTFGLTNPSPGTIAVIENWVHDVKSQPAIAWSVRTNLTPLITLSPDFALA